jgi:rod shape-determining protein MreC
MVKLNSVSRGDGKGIILILLVISSFILIGLSEETSVEKPRSYGLSFLSFFQNLVNNSLTFLGNTFNSIGELRELKYNYEEALKLLENYAGVERELESLRSENSLLKEQMKVSSEMKFKNISSKIIGKEPDNFFSSFIIDKGSLDGINKDMAVVAYDKGLFGLVGKVEEAGFNSSIVIPLPTVNVLLLDACRKAGMKV